MKSFRLGLAFALLIAAICAVKAQNPAAPQWTRVRDDRIDILMPPGFLVDNEIEKSFILAPVRAGLPQVIDLFERPRMTGTLKSVRIVLSVYQLRQVSAAKNYLWFFAGRDNSPYDSQNIQAGEFTGKITFYDTDKYLRARIAVAVKNRVYLIDASAKKEDREIYEQILGSLNLGGQSLLKTSKSNPPAAAPSVLISNLPTSPEIWQALNQKPDKSEIRSAKAGLDALVEEKDERDFSRAPIVLRQPLTVFGRDSQAGEKAGKIILKVTLLATGNIGGITAYSDLPEEVVDQTIKSARGIKFLPAEIDGKKVDAVETIRYVFEGR